VKGGFPMKQLKILVVDDDLGLADLLGLILEDCGHKIRVASSGEDGLKIFHQEDFDLLITDRNMPGMLGEEVIKKIKLLKPSTKGVLMSAMDKREEEEIRPVAMAAGADGFFNKAVVFSEPEKVIADIFPQSLPP